MRRGFTMVELIFIIVIIGILATIAIPQLNATRDDAKYVTEIQNLSTCIQDISTAYTSAGTEINATNIASCKALACFNINGSGDTDGKIEVAKNSNTTGNYCDKAYELAEKKNLFDKTVNKKEIIFGGSNIKF